MYTTTFTIESVHGVKQTFVLGPLGKESDRDTHSADSGQSAREADVQGASSNRSTR